MPLLDEGSELGNIRAPKHIALLRFGSLGELEGAALPANSEQEHLSIVILSQGILLELPLVRPISLHRSEKAFSCCTIRCSAEAPGDCCG